MIPDRVVRRAPAAAIPPEGEVEAGRLRLRCPLGPGTRLTPQRQTSGAARQPRRQSLSILRYMADNWDTLGPQVGTHLQIVGVCVALATAVGLGLGVAAARWDRLATVLLAVTSTILTVPSFALFGLLSIWFGLGNA